MIKLLKQPENVLLPREYYALSGLALKHFWNTHGMPYREMGLSKKLPEMSEDEQIKLLATDGMAVIETKRTEYTCERVVVETSNSEKGGK